MRSDVAEQAPPASRRLLLQGAGWLLASLLLMVAMRVSTDPVPGDFSYRLLGWVRQITTIVGCGCLVAASTLKALAGGRAA